MGTSHRTAALTHPPLEVDPQLDDRGHAWVEYRLTPTHAAVIAEQLIGRLRLDHKTLVYVQAAALQPPATTVHPQAVDMLAALLARCVVETDAQTCEDHGHDLAKAARDITDPAAIEAALGGENA